MDERLVLPAASTAADVLATAVTVPPLLGNHVACASEHASVSNSRTSRHGHAGQHHSWTRLLSVSSETDQPSWSLPLSVSILSTTS
jgi:hypothetical protein